MLKTPVRKAPTARGERSAQRADGRTRLREQIERSTAPIEPFRPNSWALRQISQKAYALSLAHVDGWLVAIIAGICAFGLVMVYSASEALGYLWYGNPSYFFERQLLWLAVGVTGLIVAARIDYHRFLNWAKPFLWVTVTALILVLVPHIGTEADGARRWFTIGPLSIQPSAIATLVTIMWMARWFHTSSDSARSPRMVFRFMLVFVGLLFLVLLEKDLGSAIVLAAMGWIMAMIGGIPKRFLFGLSALFAFFGYVAVHLETYRLSRLSVFWNPFADPLGSGYQPVQSLLALGSGGLTGVGLGHSLQKYAWLPEAHTDFIFAIIGEELGLIGTSGVIILFLLFAWRGIRSSLRAPDTFGSLLAGGIVAWISVQAFVNVAAVTNVIPTTGVPLPFISYGGSSLAMTLVAVGILFNVSAQAKHHGVTKRAHIDRWRRDGRPPDASTRRRRRAEAQ